jgi:hypothetical protein
MNIKFTTTDTVGPVGFFIQPPVPAKSVIPEWYKDMPPTIDNQKKLGISINSTFASNSTVKGCSPFLDALLTGYIYCAPADIEVRRVDKKDYTFKWRSQDPLLTEHHPEQYPGLPAPAEFDKNHVLKWASPFVVSTPEGYSCLFTHPLNRYDLPFRTLSGVVDTDSFTLPVQFPFQMAVEVEDILIIEKGTPVCQIIPFKRENWKHEVLIEDSRTSSKKRFEYFSSIVKPYKKQHWSKKSYD